MDYLIRTLEGGCCAITTRSGTHAELIRWNNNVEKAETTIRARINKFASKFIIGIDFNPVVLPDGILGSPGPGYVREWILRHTKVLASLDLHPDTFQPHVSIQTSVLILERKDPALVALEHAAGRMNDYQVFMPVVNHIGHDKRGNSHLRER